MVNNYIINMFDTPNISEIEKSRKLFEDMALEVEKFQKLSQLAFKDYVATVAKEIRNEDFYMICEDAVKWATMIKTQKIDKRKKYKEKEAFECFYRFVTEYLLDDNIEIVSISNYMGLQVSFKTPALIKRKFELNIPNNRNLSEYNFYEQSCGKYRLNVVYEDHPNCSEYVFSSYNRSEFKKFFKDYTKPQEIW